MLPVARKSSFKLRTIKQHFFMYLLSYCRNGSIDVWEGEKCCDNTTCMSVLSDCRQGQEQSCSKVLRINLSLMWRKITKRQRFSFVNFFFIFIIEVHTPDCYTWTLPKKLVKHSQIYLNECSITFMNDWILRNVVLSKGRKFIPVEENHCLKI